MYCVRDGLSLNVPPVLMGITRLGNMRSLCRAKGGLKGARYWEVLLRMLSPLMAVMGVEWVSSIRGEQCPERAPSRCNVTRRGCLGDASIEFRVMVMIPMHRLWKGMAVHL